MKHIIFTIMLTLATLVATAQTAYTNHNLMFAIGGGLGSMEQKLNQGEASLGGGGLLQGTYQYMISRTWGVQAGLEFALYNASTMLDYNYEAWLVHPDNNRDYLLKTGFYGWKESQTLLNVNIPIQGVYRKNFTDHVTLQCALGAVVSLPLYKHYEATEGQYITEGYFPSTNVTYRELHNHGFTTTDADHNGSFEMKSVIVSVAADLGVLYNITNTMGLYAGIYASYAVNNGVAGLDKMLYDGNSYNGVYQSDCITALHPLNAGLKLALRLGIGGDYVGSFQEEYQQ